MITTSQWMWIFFSAVIGVVYISLFVWANKLNVRYRNEIKRLKKGE